MLIEGEIEAAVGIEPGSKALGYDDDGIDRSLIRWMLKLTPTERLEFLDSSCRMIASARPSLDGTR